MKLATWNVNSLNVRLPHVLDWLMSNKPDVLCLQETKLEDFKFPYEAIAEAGYRSVHSGQKTYNGVAILSLAPAEDVTIGIPNFIDPQKRLISATVDSKRIVCAYFPNGQSVDSDKYIYKLSWIQALYDWLSKELKSHSELVLLGDFNIAPEDKDCYDPVGWKDQVLVSQQERKAFKEFEALGLVDTFRLFEQTDSSFSWWDYRMGAFRRNMGLRIDHILVSQALKNSCRASYIDKEPRKLERPSDHAPVVLELE